MENNNFDDEKKTILIVDDEQKIVDLLVHNLTREGYNTIEANDGQTAIDLAISQRPDLILLDVMIPRVDGLTVCKKIKNYYNVPILMVSAKDDELDKIVGLEIGADDYITKPFHIKELVARVKVVLKRKVNIENTDILEYDDLKLDIRTGKMSANGNEISINGKELDLLETLLLNKTQIVNREILANKIWGYDSEAEYNNVEVYMSFLRKKLKLIKSNVKIKAIRGIGYKLEAENDKKIK